MPDTQRKKVIFAIDLEASRWSQSARKREQAALCDRLELYGASLLIGPSQPPKQRAPVAPAPLFRPISSPNTPYPASKGDSLLLIQK
jgi:hypothetical protein